VTVARRLHHLLMLLSAQGYCSSWVGACRASSVVVGDEPSTADADASAAAAAAVVAVLVLQDCSSCVLVHGSACSSWIWQHAS
jgi:hypothetical protein